MPAPPLHSALGAIGLDILLADGTTHQLLWAEQAGVRRQINGIDTRDAVLFRAFGASGTEVKRFCVE